MWSKLCVKDKTTLNSSTNNESPCIQSLRAWMRTHRDNTRGEKHTQRKKQLHIHIFVHIYRNTSAHIKPKPCKTRNANEESYAQRRILFTIPSEGGPHSEDKTSRGKEYSRRPPCQENYRHYPCFFPSPLRETLGALCTCR